MATITRVNFIRQVIKPRVVLWLASVSALATLVALLSVAIKNNPFPSQDRTVLDWITGWDFPGLTGFFEVTSFLTNNYPAMVLGLAGIAFLWLIGLTREAVAFAVIGGIVGIIATLGDFTLGEVVGRSRPLEETSGPSFPSGHVYGTTVIFGMWGVLGGLLQGEQETPDSPASYDSRLYFVGRGLSHLSPGPLAQRRSCRVLAWFLLASLAYPLLSLRSENDVAVLS